jgi:GAF domain-containing protein
MALTSAAFAAGPARRQISGAAARLLARALDSGCAITWLASERRMAPVAVAHPGRPEQIWLRALAREDPAGIAGAFGAKVCQTGQPAILCVVWSSLLRLWTSPVYWPYLERHEVSGLLVLPLCARGTVVGVLTVWREHPRAAFDEGEVQFLEEVSRRLALC